ncbi:pyridoxal phosphate-dependent aminotransferase [Candidatus Micrarchaeota archaeon]|nr:pyridoxal phosphate-dependent aminotransferase [Candidatus Micrarchaeota archaeon]
MGFYELAEKALALERAGKKVVRLNVGDTNLPAPECATDAAVARLRKSKSGYGPSAGLPELRERIADREGCSAKNVVVGPGSKHLIYGLLSVLCSEGDTAAFPAPYWPAYPLACRQLGLKVKALESSLQSGWSFEPPEAGEGGAAKAKILLICNPLNPTSTVYPEKLVREVVSDANREGAHVILDEAYKGLSFREIPRYDGERLIRVRSFSKEFSMEGWRLGYAVAPDEVAKRLIAFNQITATCVAPFVQEAGIACLADEKRVLDDARSIWISRANEAGKALADCGFRFAKPEAGIYVFATHPAIKDSGKFALSLLDSEGIAVAPGSEFGPYEKFIRICVNQQLETLHDAISRMGRFLATG